MRTIAVRRFRGAHYPPPLRLILTACISVLILAAAIASPVQAQAQATDTPPAATQDLRQTALGFRNAQDYDKAIECYTALLAQNPADALSIKVDLGLCYKAKKDYSNAMPLFTEVAASQDGRKAWAMFYIEDCHCEQGKIADAVAELTQAYTDCPDARADVLLRRAARQCDIQKYKEALADYDEFLAKYPDKKELIATFSARLPEVKLRATGLFDGPASGLEAEWARAKTEGSDPAYVKLVSYRLGECCMRDQLWVRAAEVYEGLVSQYPDDLISNKASLGLAYKGGKDYSKAIPLFEDAANSTQGDKCREFTFWALDCLTEQKKSKEAIAYLDKMLAAHPDWKHLIDYRRACCLCDLRQLDSAIGVLRDYIAETPDKDFARNAELMIAQITRSGLRKPDDARVLVEAFVKDHPDYPGIIEAHTLLAGCAYMKHDYAAAAELYKSASEMPEIGNFRPFDQYMVGDCYAHIEDYTRAVEAWTKLKDTYPNDSWTPYAISHIARIRQMKEVK